MAIREELKKEQKEVERRILNFIKKQNGATTYQIFQFTKEKGLVRGYGTLTTFLLKMKADGKIKSKTRRQGMRYSYFWEVV